MASLFFSSFVHALMDRTMITIADSAYDIEKAMESSITLLVQLVALTSGIIPEASNVTIPLISGRTITIDQSKW
jgi:hypothetical protein